MHVDANDTCANLNSKRMEDIWASMQSEQLPGGDEEPSAALQE